jgi:hypothetical protein
LLKASACRCTYHHGRRLLNASALVLIYVCSGRCTITVIYIVCF